jgi:peroxiredoxin
MAHVPQTNTQASDFTLLNGDAHPVKLSSYRGKNVMLSFYPADWSPVCTNELALFQEVIEDIHSYNAEVLGLSVDQYYSHRTWAEHMHLSFPLL